MTLLTVPSTHREPKKHGGFSFLELDLLGLTLVTSRRFDDDRGCFIERYKRSAFEAAGITDDFVQDNVSVSKRGVLRGMHFQHAGHAQGKLVWAATGCVWDVCVDLRPDSTTRFQWQGVTLRGEEPTMLYVPPGFAHGFVVLSEQATVSYKCTKEYHPKAEGGVRWDDPDLAITWPTRDVHLSEKDACLPFLGQL